MDNIPDNKFLENSDNKHPRSIKYLQTNSRKKKTNIASSDCKSFSRDQSPMKPINRLNQDLEQEVADEFQDEGLNDQTEEKE